MRILCTMTKLAEYLSKPGLNQKAFADKVSSTQATISRIANGKARPGIDLAVRIERETGGEVPVVSWSITNNGVSPQKQSEAPK